MKLIIVLILLTVLITGCIGQYIRQDTTTPNQNIQQEPKTEIIWETIEVYDINYMIDSDYYEVKALLRVYDEGLARVKFKPLINGANQTVTIPPPFERRVGGKIEETLVYTNQKETKVICYVPIGENEKYNYICELYLIGKDEMGYHIK